MKTDYLDLVQFHASPSKAELEEHGGLQALQDLQRRGKVRFIGISGTLPNLKSRSRWASSTPSRSRTRPWSASTRR